MKQIFILGLSISSENQKYLVNYFEGPSFLVQFSERSLLAEISDLLAPEVYDVSLILTRDSWFGPEFREALPDIIQSYAERFSNWGMVGNAGTLWNGEPVSFRRLAPFNPRKENSPRICLTIDEPLLLINLNGLRQAHVKLPPTFNGRYGIGTVLSACCLEGGLLTLADSRLFAVHDPLSEEECKKKPLDRYSELTQFLDDRYLNHRYTVREAVLDLAEVREQYEYLELPPPQQIDSPWRTKTDLISHYDRALVRLTKRKPQLEVVTRTVLTRRGLLERALSAAHIASHEAPATLDLSFRLVSDRSPELLEKWTSEFRNSYPGLSLSSSSFQLREGRFSRTDILLQAIETSVADYIWFVDDDDFIYPSSLIPIGRALADQTPRALIGPSVVYEEQWDSDQAYLQNFEAKGIFLKEGVFKVFSGENYIPICSMILPVSALKDVIKNVRASGDYLEDYFLLLSYLSSPLAQIELLETPFAGISIRGDENTVRKLNKAHWEFSYAQVFEELLSSKTFGFSPKLFQFARPRS